MTRFLVVSEFAKTGIGCATTVYTAHPEVAAAEAFERFNLAAHLAGRLTVIGLGDVEAVEYRLVDDEWVPS